MIGEKVRKLLRILKASLLQQDVDREIVESREVVESVFEIFFLRQALGEIEENFENPRQVLIIEILVSVPAIQALK